MWRPCFLLVWLLLALPLGAGASVCDTPAEVMAGARAMPAVLRGAQLLSTGLLSTGLLGTGSGPLRVLVLGSGSITGPGASGAEASWPARLRTLLEARFPGRGVDVTIRGGRGVTVADHLALLRDGLGADPPSLVVWQAGTVEAVGGLDPDEMGEAMRQGAERIRRRGADLIIMDQQFSRFLRANTNIEPYRDKLRLVAAASGASFFSRYDLMLHWVDSGKVDMERAPRASRIALTDRLNDCLARALSDFIAQGVSEAR